MNWLKKIANQELISQHDFEDLMKRVFNRNREYLIEEGITDWKQWLNVYDAHNLAMVLDSDFDIFDRYFKNLPDNITSEDLIEIYKRGELPQVSKQYSFIQESISPTDVGKQNLPWQPKSTLLTPEEVKELYSLARQRINNSNRSNVLHARKDLYMAFNTDQTLSHKLGISNAELIKFMRQQSGLKASLQKTEERLNYNVPPEHQWIGITNSSFLGQMQISPQDIDKLVKKVEVTDEGKNSYQTNKGETLRRYIANTFLAIDTRISYKNLSFKIGSCKKGRGEYSSQTNLITISDLLANTVSHEIGHYLDYKFAKDYGDKFGPLSRSVYTAIPEKHKLWAKKYKEFIHNLMDKSDIRSEYSQDPSEVFARFIDKFVRWCSNRKFNFYPDVYFDKFSVSDFQIFVRLLQEKSYLDAKFPLSKSA